MRACVCVVGLKKVCISADCITLNSIDAHCKVISFINYFYYICLCCLSYMLSFVK